MKWAEWISEWVPVGPTRHLGAAGGVAPCCLVSNRDTPLGCIQCQKFLNIPEKIMLKFYDILSTFIFGSFFIARIIQKTG
jgi:hypothetical protein